MSKRKQPGRQVASPIFRYLCYDIGQRLRDCCGSLDRSVYRPRQLIDIYLGFTTRCRTCLRWSGQTRHTAGTLPE